MLILTIRSSTHYVHHPSCLRQHDHLPKAPELFARLIAMRSIIHMREWPCIGRKLNRKQRANLVRNEGVPHIDNSPGVARVYRRKAITEMIKPFYVFCLLGACRQPGEVRSDVQPGNGCPCVNPGRDTDPNRIDIKRAVGLINTFPNQDISETRLDFKTNRVMPS